MKGGVVVLQVLVDDHVVRRVYFVLLQLEFFVVSNGFLGKSHPGVIFAAIWSRFVRNEMVCLFLYIISNSPNLMPQDDLSIEEWRLVVRLKSIFKIPWLVKGVIFVLRPRLSAICSLIGLQNWREIWFDEGKELSNTVAGAGYYWSALVKLEVIGWRFLITVLFWRIIYSCCFAPTMMITLVFQIFRCAFVQLHRR